VDLVLPRLRSLAARSRRQSHEGHDSAEAGHMVNSTK
jgi:hypothetical protein